MITLAWLILTDGTLTWNLADGIVLEALCEVMAFACLAFADMLRRGHY